MDSILEAKRILLQELSCDHVNSLRVRELCRDHPGLIATAGLRVRIWTLLLLGDVNITDNESIVPADIPCMEQHVLEADVRRTRGDIESFRSKDWLLVVTQVLQKFCVKHGVQ